MSNNRFTFDGLTELRAALRRLPAHLAEEAEGIIDNRAELAKAEIVQTYPRRTGNLRDGVSVKDLPSGQYGAGRLVQNRAQHAYLFEVGTEARHTKLGADRGSMPAGKVFIPAVIRHRRKMYEELKALLAREGLEVTGDA